MHFTRIVALTERRFFVGRPLRTSHAPSTAATPYTISVVEIVLSATTLGSGPASIATTLPSLQKNITASLYPMGLAQT